MMRNFQALIDQAIGEKKAVERSLSTVKAELKTARIRLDSLEKAQAFLQIVAQETQRQLKIHIEDIVNLALDAIFPDQYFFEVNFLVSYGKTTANLCFISKRSGYMVDPMIASGGGVVDVCSFALRLSCWSLSRGIDSVLIFDEPFRFVSRDLVGQVGTLLRELAEKLEVQIVMTTHIPALVEAADQVFSVRLNPEGISTVKIGL
jgi:DNA repair exonuclease SbcCD ATPase subunit